MRVCLIQIDGKMPNLALMRLSTWHKTQGHEVTLLVPEDLKGLLLLNTFDKYYAATIFDSSRPLAEKLHKMGVIVGGTGWDIGSKLPPGVEAIEPDYELYGIDYGIGFTSRGCVRKCKFCVVPAKEGDIKDVYMPSNIKNPKGKKLILLDNNFLASPLWREKCQDIIDNKYKVDFIQGLDIRLVNEENAAYLAKMKHEKYIRFAFDDIGLMPIVCKGIEILKESGIKSYRLMLYVLVNFNSTIQEDLKRIEIIEKYGCTPFVMVYDKDTAPKQIKDLARWCNRPWLRNSCRFSEYNCA